MPTYKKLVPRVINVSPSKTVKVIEDEAHHFTTWSDWTYYNQDLHRQNSTCDGCKQVGYREEEHVWTSGGTSDWVYKDEQLHQRTIGGSKCNICNTTTAGSTEVEEHVWTGGGTSDWLYKDEQYHQRTTGGSRCDICNTKTDDSSEVEVHQPITAAAPYEAQDMDETNHILRYKRNCIRKTCAKQYSADEQTEKHTFGTEVSRKIFTDNQYHTIYHKCNRSNLGCERDGAPEKVKHSYWAEYGEKFNATGSNDNFADRIWCTGCNGWLYREKAPEPGLRFAGLGGEDGFYYYQIELDPYENAKKIAIHIEGDTDHGFDGEWLTFDNPASGGSLYTKCTYSSYRATVEIYSNDLNTYCNTTYDID